jgi:predicted RNA methylase
MIPLPDGAHATFLTEADVPPPGHLHPVGDDLSARDALARLQAGEHLLWTGDWHQGRQLAKAVERRLAPRSPATGTALARWQASREVRRRQGEVLGRLLVRLGADGSVALRRAPDTRRAVDLAWGPADTPRLVALRTLVGALGAAGWTDKGLDVPGLQGTLVPRFGVFSPTRHAYLGLLDPVDPTGLHVLDVGSGTGVLGLALLQRGSARVTATDIDPRAVSCTRDNARRLGLDDRLEAVQADLFPPGLTADLVVFNPPWLPEAPRTRLDRAIFDAGGRTLAAFLERLPDHLTPDGEAILLLSDLAERLGLRDRSVLPAAARRSGLTFEDRDRVPAAHRRPDGDDPLTRARAEEHIHRIHLRRDETASTD